MQPSGNRLAKTGKRLKLQDLDDGHSKIAIFGNYIAGGIAKSRPG